MPKPWYSIQAKADGEDTVAEVRIYDEIGFWGTTAKGFVTELDAATVSATRIIVSINSPGGSVFDANAIYNALLRHRLPVTTRVDGVAASAASLIFMAGDERIMPENAMLMIHNAWTIAAGTAEELRKTAEMMDKVRAGLVAAYSRSGQSEAEIIKMMDETTWMDALDAQALGFSTALEAPVKIAASAAAADLLANLPGAPPSLVAQFKASDDQAPPPPPAAPVAPEPEPAPPAQASTASLVAHVYAECRSRGMPQLAEAVLLTADLSSQDAAGARLKAAEEIAGLCMACKLSDKAADFVSAGLGVEQVRARLFDLKIAAESAYQISNLQRPAASPSATAGGPHPAAIYAARKAKSGT